MMEDLGGPALILKGGVKVFALHDIFLHVFNALSNVSSGAM